MDASLRGHAAYQQQQQQLQAHQLQHQSHYHQHHSHQQQHQLAYHHRGGSSLSSLGGGAGSVSGQRSMASMSQQQQQQQHPDYMSVGSYYSRGSHASSQTSSVVDEAYRRLGHRLSRRAHGDQPLTLPQRLESLGLTPTSVFEKFQLKEVGGEGDSGDASLSRNGDATAGSDANGVAIDRTNKVAKTRYSDHGDHQHKISSQKGNILKKMTMNAKEYFRLWQAETAASKGKGRKKRVSSSTQQTQQQQQQQIQQSPQQDGQPSQGHIDLSPQRFAFSQLALETGSAQQQQQQSPRQQHHALHHQKSHPIADDLQQQFFNADRKKHGMQQGLLSAVIESSSQTSSHSRSKGTGSIGSTQSKSSSIATRSTLGSKSDASNFRNLPRGKCLTHPPDPVANDGHDNCEGNLVVFENDTIRVSRKQIHAISKEHIKDVTKMEFRILGLLGQGTFAQVFQCLNMQTGKLVAVKIVKNTPAYTRQAVVEIDVFRALTNKNDDRPVSSSQSHANQRSVSPTAASVGGNSVASGAGTGTKWDYMVNLECYFMYKSHLCLVFELLGLNLYEVLKKRQFRGLPLAVVRTLVRQALRGIKELAQKSIVHCDLKPENILLVSEDDVDSVVSAGEARRMSGSVDKNKSNLSASLELTNKKMEQPAKASALSAMLNSTSVGSNTPATMALSQSPTNSAATNPSHSISPGQKIKVIDFGSACFEGQTAHTYIQSRFYRSPEVLIGLPYDSAIDMWSLGCVAAELFLGLPILPGVHEHDQLCRVCEMIAKLPDWMLDSGSKSSKYFVKYVPRSDNLASAPSPPPNAMSSAPSPRPVPQWREKTQQEYIASLSQSEIRKKGGLAKLEKQPMNRYFKQKKLVDIILHKGQSTAVEDSENLQLFVHFLYGLLDPDPWKRWTAHQACQHPFITGGSFERRSSSSRLAIEIAKDENQANAISDIYWEPPWDPGICRRKLLNVQKTRERQQAARRGYSNSRPSGRHSVGSLDDNSVGGRSMQESPTRGIVQSNDLSGNQGHQAMDPHGRGVHAQHNNMPLTSSSFSDYAANPGMVGRLAGDASSVAGDTRSNPMYPPGPQSFQDVGNYGSFTGSLNAPDFAYVLQRPGVVPMGESVSSSVDISISGRSPQYQLQPGSYGANRMQQRSQRRDSTNSLPITSRSFDRNDSEILDDQRRHSHMGNRSGPSQPQSVGGHGSYGGQHDMNPSVMSPRSRNLYGGNDPPSILNNAYQQAHDLTLGSPELQQQHAAYGHAQAYLQQQHAALQQQQALLQQQQVALALQQEQLRAYGISAPGMNFNGAAPFPGLPNGGMGVIPGNAMHGIPNNGMAGVLPDMNFGGVMPTNAGTNQYGTTGGGYYYVSSSDGTPMLSASSNPMAQPGLSMGALPMHSMGGQLPNSSGYHANFDPNANQDQNFHPPGSGGYRGMNM